MSHAAPVPSTDRIETLDVLRGFALLGILAMNIRAMAGPFSSYMYPFALYDYEGANRAAYIFTSVVFDLKMMGLFSMLFGAGVLLYAAKPTPDGRPPRALWFRRMFWLLVIGLVHAYLIWDGDILVPYALTGMLLLWWVRRLPAGAIVRRRDRVPGDRRGRWGSFRVSPGTRSPLKRARSESQLWMPTREQAQEQLAKLHGGYLDVVADRASFVIMAQTVFFIAFFFWRVGGMMMLGMALYKWGFLDGRRSPRTYKLIAGICLPFGLALSTIGIVALERAAFRMPDRTFADQWNYAGSILTSIGFAAALILLVKYDAFRGLRRALAAVGQMAFSNYLFQSIITSMLFLGWGFGLAGRFDYAGQLVIVAMIWTFQLAVSPWWLSSYRFGPAEWLWRSLTYWQRQPMRRAA